MATPVTCPALVTVATDGVSDPKPDETGVVLPFENVANAVAGALPPTEGVFNAMLNAVTVRVVDGASCDARLGELPHALASALPRHTVTASKAHRRSMKLAPAPVSHKARRRS
jgi:hypothetical protein